MRGLSMSKKKSSVHAANGEAGLRRSLREGGVLRSRPVTLPFGTACAVMTDDLLHSVEWESSPEALEKTLARKYPDVAATRRGGGRPGDLLRAYGEGKILRREEIAAVRFDWSLVTPFSRTVLEELAKVPYGKSITYGELAVRCGRPGAARAVGNVLSRNRWPLLLPCHRVLGAGQRIGGFAKGAAVKEALIRFEEKTLAGGIGAQ